MTRTLVNVHDGALGHVRVAQYDNGDLMVQVAGRDIQVRDGTTAVGSGFTLCYHEDCARCAEDGPGGYMMIRHGPTCERGQHGIANAEGTPEAGGDSR